MFGYSPVRRYSEKKPIMLARTAAKAIFSAACLAAPASAQSLHVVPPNQFCWGENVGYFNWAGAGSPAGSQAAVYFSRPAGGFFRGFVWGENVGWVNLGNGDGPYLNTSGQNFGVNANVSGQLSGMAWGENIGWINFGAGALASPAQPARIDFVAGRLRGYAWGENIGWINLDDASVFVALGGSCRCDLNHDGMVDDADFVIFLSAYNLLECADPTMPSGCPADFNGDNMVDDTDFQLFLAPYNDLICP